MGGEELVKGVEGASRVSHEEGLSAELMVEGARGGDDLESFPLADGRGRRPTPGSTIDGPVLLGVSRVWA